MNGTRTSGEALRKLRAQVFSMYGDQCWLCGGDGADTIDHLLPVVDGGDDDLDNLRPAHGRKSDSCVGNFSRKRPIVTGMPLKPQVVKDQAVNGITYGEGWISKSFNGLTTTIFYDLVGLPIDDPLVQDFLRSK